MSDNHELTPEEAELLNQIRNYAGPKDKKTKEIGPYDDLLCLFCNTYVDDESGMCNNEECELNED